MRKFATGCRVSVEVMLFGWDAHSLVAASRMSLFARSADCVFGSVCCGGRRLRPRGSYSASFCGRLHVRIRFRRVRRAAAAGSAGCRYGSAVHPDLLERARRRVIQLAAWDENERPAGRPRNN